MDNQKGNLQQRNQKWYFRHWIPGHLQSKLQLREIKRVLPARNLQSARSMANLLAESLKGTWNMLKELQLSPAQASDVYQSRADPFHRETGRAHG